MRRVASGLLLLFVVAAGPASGEEGMASIYGSEAGSRRADGHRFVPSQIGCAHRTRISVGRLAPQLTVPTCPGTRLDAPSRIASRRDSGRLRRAWRRMPLTKRRPFVRPISGRPDVTRRHLGQALPELVQEPLPRERLRLSSLGLEE
jgi:hypothetical protein